MSASAGKRLVEHGVYHVIAGRNSVICGREHEFAQLQYLVKKVAPPEAKLLGGAEYEAHFSFVSSDDLVGTRFDDIPTLVALESLMMREDLGTQIRSGSTRISVPARDCTCGAGGFHVVQAKDLVLRTTPAQQMRLTLMASRLLKLRGNTEE